MSEIGPAEPAHEPTWTINARWFVAGVVTVLLIGLALGATYILGHHLWHDEILTRHIVSRGPGEFINWFRSDTHPPLYFAFVLAFRYLSLGLATDETLRLVSLIWLVGAGAITLYFGIRRPKLRIPLAITFSAMALSPMYSYLYAEYRPYGLLATVTLLTLLLGIKVLMDGGPPAWGVVLALGVAMAASVLTHYTGGIAAAALGISLVTTMTIQRSPGISRVFVSGIVALGLFAPWVPMLRIQLEDNLGLVYRTPIETSAGYVAWAFGLIGFATLGFGFAIVAIRVLRGRPSVDAEREGHHWKALILFPVLAAVILLATTTAITAILEVDLLNFGASLMPGLMLIFAAASFFGSVAPRAALVVTLAAVSFVLPLTAASNSEPWRLKENHVSTVDVFRNLVSDKGLTSDLGRSLAVLPVDNPRSLEYFMELAPSQLPRATYVPVWIGDAPGVTDVLEDVFSDPAITAALILIRHNPDAHIYPRVPEGFEIIRIHRYAGLIVRGDV